MPYNLPAFLQGGESRPQSGATEDGLTTSSRLSSAAQGFPNSGSCSTLQRSDLMSPYFSRSHHGWPPADLRDCLLFLFQPQPLSLLPATQVLARQRHHGQQGPGCRTVQGAWPTSRESGDGTIGAGGGPHSTVFRFSSCHSDHPKPLFSSGKGILSENRLHE